MRIAVIGATGHTGRLVVEQALARGHEVVALARTPSEIGKEHPNLEVGHADVLEPDGLADLLAGAGAVISALGIGSSRSPTEVYSKGVTNELRAMAATGVHKLAVISAAPVGSRAEQPFLERRIAMPLLERFFEATYQDMRRMEATLQSSDADWIALRPPRLVSKPAIGAYRLDTKPLPNARTLTYADLAAALLDVADRDDLYQRAVYIAN